MGGWQWTLCLLLHLVPSWQSFHGHTLNGHDIAFIPSYLRNLHWNLLSDDEYDFELAHHLHDPWHCS